MELTGKTTTAARDMLLRLINEQSEQLTAIRTLLAQHEQTLASLQALATSTTDILSETNRSSATSSSIVIPPEDVLARFLAETSYDALLGLDDELRLVLTNHAAEQLFGRAFTAGERLADYTGSPELELLVLDALAYQEEQFEDQFTFNQRTFRVRLHMTRHSGHVYLALALQDVTDIVHLKRARREMVANISHELRHPIANIRLIIDGLFHEGDKPKGKASRNALRDIARETDALLWLVQELWDLSMIESGDAILRMIEVPLLPLVIEACERMEDQSSAKNLYLRHSIPDNLLVLADRDQIRRVLMNLIHNSVKYSPPNGTIAISAESDGVDVTISVSDEGPGVPEEHVNRIFERFYQVDPARSRGEGTGLGLAICKHIVEAHDGRIWTVSNREASGGRFFFTLPCARVGSP